MEEEFKSQIEKIRQSGKTNMLDIVHVQRIAFKKKYFKLVIWLTDHKKEYAKYILTGKEPK